MSHPVRACMRCGHEGVDVRMRMADLEAEAKEDGERLGSVTVAVPVGESRTGPGRFEYAEVPARYGREPRCIDRAACRDRVAESRRQPAQPVEEALPWL